MECLAIAGNKILCLNKVFAKGPRKKKLRLNKVFATKPRKKIIKIENIVPLSLQNILYFCFKCRNLSYEKACKIAIYMFK